MRRIKHALAQSQLNRNLTTPIVGASFHEARDNSMKTDTILNAAMTKRILLVDDERSIREALRKSLCAENYEVVLAENGQEAIEKHGAQRIDLLILDLNVPVINGWITLERLAAVNPLLPVIIITGRSNQRALAEKAGADAL